MPLRPSKQSTCHKSVKYRYISFFLNTTCFGLDVRGSVHDNIIHKEKPNKMQQCIKIFIITYLYEAQHVSGDTPPTIRSLKLHWQHLVFHTWKAGRVAGGQRPPATRPTAFHVWKTRGWQCSFRLLMMGGVSSEMCWASYKYGIIKILYIVASCWIFLYELHYDGRIHERQVTYNILIKTEILFFK